MKAGIPPDWVFTALQVICFAYMGTAIPDLMSGKGSSDTSKFPNTVTQPPCIFPSIKTHLLFTWDVSVLIILWLFLRTLAKAGQKILDPKQAKRKKKTPSSAANLGKSFSSHCRAVKRHHPFFCTIFEPVFLELEMFKRELLFQCIYWYTLALEALPLEVSLAVTFF